MFERYTVARTALSSDAPRELSVMLKSSKISTTCDHDADSAVSVELLPRREGRGKASGRQASKERGGTAEDRYLIFDCGVEGARDAREIRVVSGDDGCREQSGRLKSVLAGDWTCAASTTIAVAALSCHKPGLLQ